MLKRLVLRIIDVIHRMKIKFYFESNMKYILETLNERCIISVSRFKEKSWHNGYCYFRGIYKGKEVFIKVDLKLRLLENEFFFYEFLDKKLAKYLTPMYDFHQNKHLQMIVFSFISNSHELNKYNIIGNNTYLDEIIYILDEIHKANVIHRDIKLDNFMLDDKKIKIIDFTFARNINNSSNSKFKELNISDEENYQILKRLGNGLNPKVFVWNDFISMKNIIDDILHDEKLNLDEKERLKKYSKSLATKSVDKSYEAKECLNR